MKATVSDFNISFVTMLLALKETDTATTVITVVAVAASTGRTNMTVPVTVVSAHAASTRI